MQEWVDLVGSFCGDCLVSHGTPGCQNSECEAAVCAIDPFCCNVVWDFICANEAIDICVPDQCTATSSTPEPSTVKGGRAYIAEPVSKDPNYKPKGE